MDRIELAKIIKSLSQNIDPTTGEYFEPILYKDPVVLQAITSFIINALNTQTPVSEEAIWPEEDIYETLRVWRNEEAREKKIAPYCIFWNSHLRAIAQTRIKRKEDLLKVWGIGDYKYATYGDAIFELLKPFIQKFQLSSLEKINVNSVSPVDTDNKPVRNDSKSCKQCMLYRREDCFGDGIPEECEFFQVAVDISEEELERWKTIETTIDRIRRTGHGYSSDRL